jgi:hypothetical protein
MEIKHRYKINGKQYNRFEDIPEKYRKLMDKDNNGKSDLLQQLEKDPSRRKWRMQMYKNKHQMPTQLRDNRALVIGLLILAVGFLLFWFGYSM